MRKWLRNWWLLVGTVVAIAIAVVLTTPKWWRDYGDVVAAGVTAGATVVLVVVSNRLAAQATRQADLTERLASQADLQRTIIERQGLLATLPAVVIESHARDGTVVIKNKSDPPALNVEYRCLVQPDDDEPTAGPWAWVDAVMAKSAEISKDRPGPRRGERVHVQVRFLDSLGTMYLVERRWLGGGGEDAYRLFRRVGATWEHLTWRVSTLPPLMSESSTPRLTG